MACLDRRLVSYEVSIDIYSVLIRSRFTAGNSLVDVLYGAYNPSGRLPYTIAKSADDYSAKVNYDLHLTTPHIPYTEGLFVDYRHFDQVSKVQLARDSDTIS